MFRGSARSGFFFAMARWSDVFASKGDEEWHREIIPLKDSKGSLFTEDSEDTVRRRPGDASRRQPGYGPDTGRIRPDTAGYGRIRSGYVRIREPDMARKCPDTSGYASRIKPGIVRIRSDPRARYTARTSAPDPEPLAPRPSALRTPPISTRPWAPRTWPRPLGRPHPRRART